MCQEVMCPFPKELGGEHVHAGAGCTQEGPSLGTSLEEAQATAFLTRAASAPQEHVLEIHHI